MQSISQRTAQMERGRAEKHAIAVAVLLSQLLQVTKHGTSYQFPLQ